MRRVVLAAIAALLIAPLTGCRSDPTLRGTYAPGPWHRERMHMTKDDPVLLTEPGAGLKLVPE
jgi:hypothetical protein